MVCPKSALWDTLAAKHIFLLIASQYAESTRLMSHLAVIGKGMNQFARWFSLYRTRGCL